ncbi:MAG: hypothetical protein NDI70_00905 [Pseudomonas sagittaria]|nr:hypothetical protein [Pseudomonas sagittaria]
MTSKIHQMLIDAGNAVGYQDHYAVGATDPHLRTMKRAAEATGLSMLHEQAPTLNPGIDGGLYLPNGTEAGKVSTLATALLSNSVTSKAGAQIIVIDRAPPAPAGESKLPAFYTRNYRFDVVKPAQFAILADGAEVTDSDFPISRAAVDLHTMPAYSFRVNMTRAQKREYGLGFLSAELEHSIIAGIARAADAALLAAIAATTPATFSLGAAAAKGCQFADLRAIVGSSGTGAAAQQGELFVDGIAAELCMDIAPTIVGTWMRAAVAVHEDVTLIADRRSVEGDLSLTCFVNLQPLVPDAGYFFVRA